MCSERFLLLFIGDQAEGQACADPGLRTPIGTSGNLCNAIRLLVCNNGFPARKQVKVDNTTLAARNFEKKQTIQFIIFSGT